MVSPTQRATVQSLSGEDINIGILDLVRTKLPRLVNLWGCPNPMIRTMAVGPGGNPRARGSGGAGSSGAGGGRKQKTRGRGRIFRSLTDDRGYRRWSLWVNQGHSKGERLAGDGIGNQAGDELVTSLKV